MHETPFRSRPLHVRLSAPQGPKRSATTIVSRVEKSKSPAAEANGTKQEPGDDAASGERAARTLGLMNVPDTVNDARIRSLAEPYGKLVKIILRPDHQGAIVEFADVHHAGKASLELEGHEIAPGRKLHVGTVAEMLRQSAEKKSAPSQTQSKSKSGFLAGSGPVKRPPQPGARGGKRGGLGVKRGRVGEDRGETTTTNTTTTTTTDSASTKKSNDDFRAMIQRSQAE